MEMDKHLISFITPVFNAEDYLPECIESVLGQTAQNWELILIDDGSTDNSGAICDKYSGLDSRIKTIHKANNGQFDSRLKGIMYASGDYCTGLDADDFLESNCVERINQVLVRQDYDILAWNLRLVKDGRKIGRLEVGNYGEYSREKFIEYVARSTNHSFCNKLIKAKLLKISDFGIVPIDARHSEDYILLCPSMCMAKRILAIDDILYNYRQVDDSVTKKYSSKRALDYLDSTKCIFDIFSRYGITEKNINQAELSTLVGIFGYCLKQAYKTGCISRNDINSIRNHVIYKMLAGYENCDNCTNDIVIFLKLFRLRFELMILVLYGKKG